MPGINQDHAVVIAGGGPAGLMLAAELALADVDVAIIERRPGPELVGSRAGGFHSRTLEILDMRGVADRFLAAGDTVQVAMFASTLLDMSDFPTRHPYSLGLFQNRIQMILAEWVEELGVPVRYGQEVTGFRQDDSGVEVQLAGGRINAQYLVGCDGGRSLIRKQAGIEFPGWEATRSTLIAEVELTEENAKGVKHDDAGAHGQHLMDDGKTVRIVTSEKELHQGEPTLDDLRAALTRAYGKDFGVHNPTWLSRFTDTTRQAAQYRNNRVFLAGDSAHIHYPAGGQGIGLGVQDAVNLGWKLAEVVKGTSPESLLDSYQSERHPVTARVLKHTMAQAVVQRSDDRIDALRDTVGELLALDGPRKHIAGLISGLDVRYDLGDGHPLVGRRMPDLDLTIDDRPVRLFELLRQPHWLAIDFAGSGELDRADVINASYDGDWELPVIGPVPAPRAILIRPDGHVAEALAQEDSNAS
ncbi:MAG: FAD-dependent monooxygenase [Solirubrobacterales bacterium]|nr:FAD-dependent monooxygenase [Solirubrobacterales bacterium]